MTFRIASSGMTEEQEQLGVTMRRRRGAVGEMDEWKELWDQLMDGDMEGMEELEEPDWDALWDSFMGEEGGEEQDDPLGAYHPTVGGSMFLRPTTFNYF